eukprot:651377-Ditylum_brightwellii.AAC.1
MANNDIQNESEWEEISSASECWDLVSAAGSIRSYDSLFSKNTVDIQKKSYKDMLLKDLPDEGVGLEEESVFSTTREKVQIANDSPPKKRVTQRYLIDSPRNLEAVFLVEESEFLESCKPMIDKNRAKHERLGRRQNLKGHTGRSHKWLDTDLLKHVIESEKTNLVTPLGIKLGRNVNSFNRSHGWEDIPKILVDESCAVPEINREGKHYGYREVTTYQIKSCYSKKTHKHASTPEDEERSRHIFFMPPYCSSIFSSKFIPRKIFATVSPDPPDNIKGQLMTWNMRGICGNHFQCGGKKGKPVLHGDISWRIEDDLLGSSGPGGHPVLEIDFGETRVVTAVSTQGEKPPVRTYPSVTYYNSRGNRLPRGQCKVEGHLHDGKYEGPFWKVYDPDIRHCDGSVTRYNLKWVQKYELFWRADRGRQWNTLGVFDANDDTTTEKIHMLTGFQGGEGLLCRYLRFLPIDCENGGAMRI